MNKYIKQFGYSLLEILLALGIMSAVSAGIFISYKSTSDQYVIDNEIKKNEVIQSTIVSLNALTGNYDNVNNTNLLKSGGVINEATFISGWNGRIEAAPVQITPPNIGDTYKVTYFDVPRKHCNSLVSNLFTFYGKVEINTVVALKAADGVHVDLASVGGLCNTDSNTVVFTFDIPEVKCQPQHVAWGTYPDDGCTAQVDTVTDPYAIITKNASGDYSGTNSFKCVNGKLIAQGAGTCQPPSCKTQIKTYRDPVTELTCEYKFGPAATNHGSIGSSNVVINPATNATDNTKVGSVTAKCVKGFFLDTPETQPVCQKKCMAGTRVDWQDSVTTTNKCYGNSPTDIMPNAIIPTTAVTNLRPGYTGTGGGVTCDAKTGIFGGGGTGQCYKQCGPQTINWSDPTDPTESCTMSTTGTFNNNQSTNLLLSTSGKYGKVDLKCDGTTGNFIKSNEMCATVVTVSDPAGATISVSDCTPMYCPPATPYIVGCHINMGGHRSYITYLNPMTDPTMIRVLRGNSCYNAGQNGTLRCSKRKLGVKLWWHNGANESILGACNFNGAGGISSFGNFPWGP